MNQNLNFSNENLLFLAVVFLPWLITVIKEIISYRKGSDHEIIKELKTENREMRAEIKELKENISELQHENASLKGFIAGISQHDEVKRLFESILMQNKEKKSK